MAATPKRYALLLASSPASFLSSAALSAASPELVVVVVAAAVSKESAVVEQVATVSYFLSYLVAAKFAVWSAVGRAYTPAVQVAAAAQPHSSAALVWSLQ